MAGLTAPLLPTPRTWAANEKATAALLNSNVRDPVTFRQTPPIFRLTATGVTSVPSGAFTAIAWGSADIDTYGGWGAGAHPTRYIAPITGWYWVAGTVQMAAGTTGTRRVGSLWINGTNARQQEWQAVGTNAASVPVASVIFLNKGDYVEHQSWQNSGAALNVGGTSTSYIAGMWVHP